MAYGAALIVLTIALFFGLMILFEAGRRIGIAHIRADPDGSHTGVGAVESAVLGLMGLLIGFTFFGAAQRFDQRRDLVVDETNRIGTAYLRLDLLPADRQPAIRQLFREYLDTRIDFFKSLTTESARAVPVKTTELQKHIWEEAVRGAASPGAHPSVFLIFPSLNDMIDITTTRSMAMRVHPPSIVFFMLLGLSLGSAVLAGYQMAKAKARNWIHAVGFAFALSIAVYVILDMEYPRMGLIQVTEFDQALVDLRNSMQ